MIWIQAEQDLDNQIHVESHIYLDSGVGRTVQTTSSLDYATAKLVLQNWS